MKRLCACGCGQEIEIKEYHKRYGIPKYISGHNAKNPSKETIEKRSNSLKEAWKRPGFKEKRREELKGENNPFWGKTHTLTSIKKMREWHTGKYVSPETIEKMSKRMTGKNNPMYGVTSPMKGKYQSQETIDKIKKNHKGMKGKYHAFKTKKKMSATKQGIPLNQWEKFIAFEPYTFDFNGKFKESIKERDFHCCQLCNIGEEDLLLLKRYLVIHHIDYNKLLSIPQNCITLCNKCNVIVNANRTAWIVFFQKLLKERHNYQYTTEQKIILDFDK